MGPLPAQIVADATRRVHEVGGRIAVHCQDPESCRRAIVAGVDSVEHGQHLDPSLAEQMVAGRTVLVPTLAAFLARILAVSAREPSEARDRWLAGTELMRPAILAVHAQAALADRLCQGPWWSATPMMTKATPARSLTVGVCPRTTRPIRVAAAGRRASIRAKVARGSRAMAS